MKDAEFRELLARAREEADGQVAVRSLLEVLEEREVQQSLAVESRAVVGQALGILMERYDLDADRAFAVLRRTASETETKLRRVAEHLVRTRELPRSASL